jgi:hypothetical protein
VAAWQDRLKRAYDQWVQPYESWWEEAKKCYAPDVTETPDDYGNTIRTNRAFTIVSRKEADLFYQRPDVTVQPAPFLEAMPGGFALAATHGQILNEKLGLDGVNAKRLARQAIFDYELFAIGWTKIGYRAFTKDTEVDVPATDEMGQPITDPMTQQPVMTKQTVPVTIKSECFWENFSPKQGLIPAEHRSTDYDKAPWLGMRFEMPLKQAKANQEWADKIPDDFAPAPQGQPQKFESGGSSEARTIDTVSGVELYYRSMLFRDDIVHPDHLTKLVFLDGIPDPVEHRDDPDQTFDERGRLTPDSRVGFPYHPLVIRTMTDSAMVMSDVAVALPLTKELDTFRKQQLRQRDVNLIKWTYDTGVMPEPDKMKIVMAPQGGMIGLPSEAFNSPNGPIKQLPQGTYPPENFAFADRLDNDLARTFAIDATSSGTTGPSGDLSATEANLRQANANVRLGWEQGAVADWYIQGVTKFSTLIQRYLSAEDAQAIVGEQMGFQWDGWRKAVPTRLAFVMMPDSALRNDTPLNRKQHQDLLTYAANDPTINRREMWKKLLLLYHYDPSKILVPEQQMPKPKPEPPSISMSIKGEDLSPLSPQFAIVIDLLGQNGITINPQALANAQTAAALVPPQPPANGQPAHGGKLAPMESLDKHQAQKTFGMQSTGEPTPQGPMQPIQ